MAGWCGPGDFLGGSSNSMTDRSDSSIGLSQGRGGAENNGVVTGNEGCAASGGATGRAVSRIFAASDTVVLFR